ncbi:helix-turn-helix domain-containing protein [Mycobacteroides saopaulense]|uniref:helix-turn-helix domain-containing protein n=1 Tax=Mycobacteroides saopaulense TaxID=1578165 RepID=UPI001F31B100|nr:helix-turn-helix domain-containing protein [Mycobacteroides saopaulense]
MKLYGARRAFERAAMKAEYEAGASIRTIAAAHGHSYGYVHKALTQSGTELRGRGGPNNPNPVPIPPEQAYRRQSSQAPSTRSRQPRSVPRLTRQSPHRQD